MSFQLGGVLCILDGVDLHPVPRRQQSHMRNMMSKSSEYKCHANIVRLLESQLLSLQALKLIHGLYFFIDQHPSWTLFEMNGGTNNRICRVRSTEIMAAVGPRGAKDNDMIKGGVRDLQGTGLLDVLKLSACSRKIEFQFSRRFVRSAEQAKGDMFAMLDTDLVAAMRSPAHILFYTQAAMTGSMRYPVFYLPGIGTEEGTWKLTKRLWLRAAAKVSGMLDQQYLLIPELGRFRDDVERVRVKITSTTTEWHAGKLYPRHSPEPVCVVWDGQSKTLSHEELKGRRNWQRVHACQTISQICNASSVSTSAKLSAREG